MPVADIKSKIKIIPTSQEDAGRRIYQSVGRDIEECLVDALIHCQDFQNRVDSCSIHYNPQLHAPNLTHLQQQHRLIAVYFYGSPKK